MKKLTLAIAVLTVSLASAQSFDWTRLGFKAEPGLSVGTPCLLNLTARFWLGNFGVSTCGIYSPPGFDFLSGGGLQADVMYRLQYSRRQPVVPYLALGYGLTDVRTKLASPQLKLKSASYVGLSAGAYYMGGFAQLGLGVGSFVLTAGSSVTKMPVFPLLQIGYVYSIGGKSADGSKSGGGSGRSGGGSGSGGGRK